MIKNWILGVVFVGIATIGGVYGCKGTELTPEERLVQPMVTLSDNVREGALVTDIPDSELPKEVREALPEDGNLVIVAREDLLDENEAVSLETPGDNPEVIWRVVLGAATAFFPGLAVWEGVLTLLFKRKRQLWGKAIVALNPFIENHVAIGEAVHAVGAAIGAKHSSEKSEIAFEKEVISDKKENLKAQTELLNG